MPQSDSKSAISAHYARPGLSELLLAALEQAGKDIHDLKPEELAPIDEFHVRGREATLELARAAGLAPGLAVLDVGSGLGGPSRCIARDFGCRVVGIDLVEDYCRAATALAERVGMSGQVRYQQGDALALPFAPGSFDVVWTQHTAMNIAAKPSLYQELGRVLRPGGTLAIYDIIAEADGPLHFPLPWAAQAASSHLVTVQELRELLAAAGFQVRDWQDTTAKVRLWFNAVARRLAEKGPPLLGLHLVLGDDFAVMTQNLRRGLEEGVFATVQVVATRT